MLTLIPKRKINEKAQENTQKCLFIYQTPLIKSELKEHNAE
jgi:hypothetical protein